jgi:hypothetical protein
MSGTMPMSESIKKKIANIFLIFTRGLTRLRHWDCKNEISSNTNFWKISWFILYYVMCFLSFIYGVICHTFVLIWSNLCLDYLSFFHHNQGLPFFMIVKTPHKNGKKFIPKLRSLSEINVHNLDFKIVEFVNVTNKSIQFF